MTYPTDTPAPWPFYTAKQAAGRLRVEPDLIRGLANGPGLRAHKTFGATGGEVWLFCREDVDALAGKVRP